MNTEVLGIVAGVVTASSLVPQIVKSFREKKVNVSPFMFIALIAGNGLWTYYGIVKQDLPIIVTNSFSLLMDFTMLILKVKYHNNRRS